ncbi:12346_t:CDS:2 [Funneliformis mosseae]|uniref:12346_t:CDS:1 n=1 Tax=Funneliformis mosseae TaxID=27381 RepID=A0A9N8YR58_FUNMO|nr:12346_t:CDS:2 [Funneliformis mosseae]
MGENLTQFHFFEPEKSEKRMNKPKKREPNMFISYRKEMMKHKPPNMQMTEYSKLVSKWWRNLSEGLSNFVQDLLETLFKEEGVEGKNSSSMKIH